MSPRTGRPKAENAKKYNQGVRLDEGEKAKLDYCVEKTGMGEADILRKGLDMIYQELLQKEKE